MLSICYEKKWQFVAVKLFINLESLCTMGFEITLLLFFAGLTGGGKSALAGGSSLITFPVLMASGLPPIVANATNFLTVLPANTSAVVAYREELGIHKGMALRLSIISLVGGAIGCTLLLFISNAFFSLLVPWLLLSATLLLAFGKRLNRAFSGYLQNGGPTNTSKIGTVGISIIFVFSIYGGFYGGGLGVIMLAAMTLIGFSDYHKANAFKNLTNAVNGAVGVVIYSLSGLISWPHALVLIAGSSIGSFFAVRIAKNLPQIWLSRSMVLLGICLSGYYFWANWF